MSHCLLDSRCMFTCMCKSRCDSAFQVTTKPLFYRYISFPVTFWASVLVTKGGSARSRIVTSALSKLIAFNSVGETCHILDRLRSTK